MNNDQDLEKFITQFGGLTESYWFYENTIELRYDVKRHIYLLVLDNGTLEPVNGVTSVIQIIDKSRILVPWGCKMMAQKLDNLLEKFVFNNALIIAKSEFDNLVQQAKKAHKDKLEDAGNIGKIAHAWIENYINFRIEFGVKDAPHVPVTSFPYEERATSACKAALEWMNNHNVRWLCTERKIYSRKHKYAGTLDGLCLVDSCTDPLCCPNAFKNRLSVADWKTSNQLNPEYLMQTAAYLGAYQEETGEIVDDRWVIRLGKTDGKFEAWHLESETFVDDLTAFLDALKLVRSFEKIENRLVDLKDIYRKGKKAKSKEDKAISLKLKCKSADKYQGKRKPNCNKGNPCEYCLAKYAEVQANKMPKEPKPKKHKLTQEDIIKNLMNLSKNA